jgi:hypothetical protein
LVGPEFDAPSLGIFNGEVESVVLKDVLGGRGELVSGACPVEESEEKLDRIRLEVGNR